MSGAALIAGGLGLPEFKRMVAPGFRAHDPEDPEEWLPRHIRFPTGSEETSFDFDQAPYTRGVIRLFWKDHRRRKLNLPWGVRLGKTTIVVSLMLWQACQAPCPMGLLFPNNGALDTDLQDVLRLMEGIPVVREQLPPRHLWNKTAIQFDDCRIRIASAGNMSSVSAFSAMVIGKLEHEKIVKRASSEAGASARMDSRADGFPRHVKIMEEGSPSDVDHSEYHELDQDPDVLKYRLYCPCPHCNHFQTLEHEQVKWELGPNNVESANVARKTAWYECEHCQEKILDHHRVDMIRAGEWLAEGEKIDRRGRITGTPVNDDAETMIMGPLSSYYSLRVESWGTMAAEYVTAKRLNAQGKVNKLRKFWTEKLARVWNPKQRKTKAQAVARRMTCDDHQKAGILPAWSSFLTFTVDVGNVYEQLLFYWMVTAWGAPHGVPRGAVVDWGYNEGKTSFLKEWRTTTYPLAGSKKQIPLWGQPSCVDSGDGKFAFEIGALCAPIANCWPAKGDSDPKSTELYKLGYQRTGLTSRQLADKRKAGQADLFEPCSWPTQNWRQALVEGRTDRNTAGYVSMPAVICQRWEQYKETFNSLTADLLVNGRWEGEAAEYGDTLRYARALAAFYTENDKTWPQLKLITQRGNGAPRLFSGKGSRSSAQPFVNGWK